MYVKESIWNSDFYMQFMLFVSWYPQFVANGDLFYIKIQVFVKLTFYIVFMIAKKNNVKTQSFAIHHFIVFVCALNQWIMSRSITKILVK